MVFDGPHLPPVGNISLYALCATRYIDQAILPTTKTVRLLVKDVGSYIPPYATSEEASSAGKTSRGHKQRERCRGAATTGELHIGPQGADDDFA